MNYVSSTTFGALKGLTEAIQENYSSKQYADVLDALLYNSAQSIVEHTNWFDQFLPRILNWYATNSNRKITTVSKERLQTLVSIFLFADRADKLEVLKQMKLERNITSMLIDMFLQQLDDVQPVINYTTVHPYDAPPFDQWLQQTERSVGGHNLYVVLQNTRFWAVNYWQFRGFLIEKFTRLALVEAQVLYVKIKHQVELDPLVQDHIVAVGRAIDKFDGDKGTLTSYVQVWFRGVKTKVLKELEQLQQTQSLDHMIENSEWEPAAQPSAEDEYERSSNINMVRRLAKLVDPQGWARLKLGLEETFQAA